ncbi:hypothetical protein A2335_02845 [Candidatus Peregrinibacteria bacterium RIFOXYB2_FULL_32_7]|nr:MAG: hypothetical protein A2335_02845 [Candidatus Peregrinibacteria bacterium RIFOXYB2_FULL_32_7]
MKLTEILLSVAEFLTKDPEFSLVEKGLLIAKEMEVRQKVIDALKNTGRIGSISATLINKITKTIIWEIHYRTGLLDKIDNADPIKDLKEFRDKYSVDDNANIVYIGSGNDTSVRAVFPNTMHIDKKRYERMPKKFNFTQADAKNLPNEDASVDIIIFKYMDDATLKDPTVMKELQRILKTNGKMLFYYSYDLFAELQNIDAISDQNKLLRLFINLYNHGFKITKCLTHGTIVVEKGSNDDEKEKFEKKISENTRKMFELIKLLDPNDVAPLYIPVTVLDELNLMPKEKFGNMDLEGCEFFLISVKSQIPDDIYPIIADNLRKFFNSNIEKEEPSRLSKVFQRLTK